MKIIPFNRFRKGQSKQSQLVAVVQPHGLFFSSPSELNLAQKIDYDFGGEWQDTLISTLEMSNVSDQSIKIVLHSNLYQTYQIDKPAIPEDELKAALPFLLKDIVSERVSDIIADFSLLPASNKLQVFVVPRSLIEDIYQRLNKIKITLDSVIVEDEIWAHTAGDLSNFMMLQKSHQGSFKVSAFVEGQCAFQRTIRGVSSPLTGTASSALQLDGIALELQRSIDYLSSQLRSAPLHQMKVCCDGENQSEVAHELSQRLSVSVSPLTESNEESGMVLAQSLAMVTDTEVDLLPEQLKPNTDYFSLRNVMFGWGATLVSLLAVYGSLVYQQQTLDGELSVLKSQETEVQQELNVLNERLTLHKPSAAKASALSQLESLITFQLDSISAMSEYQNSQQQGYSGIMRSLAKLGRNDISLTSILVDSSTLDLGGVAREAKAVPNWINQFKTEFDLVGRSFQRLTIGRNERGFVTFNLKTKGESK